MNRLTIALALCTACLTAPVHAASHMKEEAPKPAAGASAPMGKQQSKMADCNRQAVDKNGDDRKAFMKTCLSAPAANDAKTLTPQQQKMKDCNASAKTQALAGDARKTFMSTCLKK